MDIKDIPDWVKDIMKKSSKWFNGFFDPEIHKIEVNQKVITLDANDMEVFKITSKGGTP